MNRRRFLSIFASTAVSATIAGPFAASASMSRWQGVALGARAEILIDHPYAEELVDAARAEIVRLEKIFSLYLEDSALSKLNRKGELTSPPLELVELLSLARHINQKSDGLFDPTIQPLWQLYAKHGVEGSKPSSSEVKEAMIRTGMEQVAVSSDRIVFDTEGMALTLNGIAQGFIADKVASLLAREGLTNALVETGEIRSLGPKRSGNPWKVGIVRPDEKSEETIKLTNGALATSAPDGTLLDPVGKQGHILHPRQGAAEMRWRLVTVSAPQAVVADALSTAFCLMEKKQMTATLAQFPGAKIKHLA